jgi:hypothetical protein
MKTLNIKSWAVLVLVCVTGFLLAKLDTSKNWNDTAVTACLILSTSFVFGALSPSYAWLWALIIGGFIFSFNVVLSHNYGSAGGFLFSFAGAYLGVLARKSFLNSESNKNG